MKYQIQKLITLLVAASLAACAGTPARLGSGNADMRAGPGPGRSISARACGFQLLLLLPIGINGRLDRANQALRERAGNDFIRNVELQESWTWAFVGTLYCSELRAQAVAGVPVSASVRAEEAAIVADPEEPAMIEAPAAVVEPATLAPEPEVPTVQPSIEPTAAESVEIPTAEAAPANADLQPEPALAPVPSPEPEVSIVQAPAKPAAPEPVKIPDAEPVPVSAAPEPATEPSPASKSEPALTPALPPVPAPVAALPPKPVVPAPAAPAVAPPAAANPVPTGPVVAGYSGADAYTLSQPTVLRGSPRLDAASLMTLRTGLRIKLARKVTNASGDWWYVQLGSGFGWIQAEALANR